MKKTLIILMFAAIASAATQTTHADYTTPSSPAVANDFIKGILDTEYARDLNSDGITDKFGGFLNGYATSVYDPHNDINIDAIRIRDTSDDRRGPYNLNILTGIVEGDNGTTDQTWTSSAAIVSARVVHTSNTNSNQLNSFGFTDNSNWITGIVDTSIIDPAEENFDGTWQWIYNGSSSFSSDSTPDHMITYEITNLNNGYEKTWLLFWNDPDGSNNFNDLVVEITANPVPAPGAFLLGGIGAACVGWLKRNRSL